MKKLYFTSLFILFFSFGFSQSYPYLNASTANENEFPVDKDTNIYMFHGNRLVKTDKNFNVIWANTYSGITFSSLLLSKTGSLYFTGTIGSNYRTFGKISSAGSLVWAKNTSNIAISASTVSVDCERLYLDRNNNLIISGGTYGGTSGSSGHLVKTDTNGVGLKLVGFTGMYSCLGGLSTVVDSSGYYKLFGLGLKPLGGFSLGMLTYSDLSDAITNLTDNSYNSSLYNIKWKFVRSKGNNGFYTRTSADLISSTYTNLVHKFSESGYFQWGRQITQTLSSYCRVYHLETDEKGSAFASMSNYNSSANHHSFIAKIDSTGSLNSIATKMLNGYFVYNFMTSSFEIPAHVSRVIHSNNYYFDIFGFNFPSSPLTVQKFTSSFSSSCTPTLVISAGSGGGLTSTPIQTPTVTVVTSFAIPSYSSTVSVVAFSVNPNFCIILNADEINFNDMGFNLYPNPANDKIYISEKTFAVNSIEIFDVNGKSIKSVANDSSIDISNLPNGIYFIRIKTDKGELKEKFIKN